MYKVISRVAAISCAFSMFSGVASAQSVPLAEVGSYTDDARSARISKLKETYKTTLSDRERELVVSRCIPAQKALGKIAERLSKTQVEREKTYASVIAALTNLKHRFDDAQIDASNLDLLIVTYQQKNTNFKLSLAEYDVALDDAVMIDCVSDPVGFRAALEGVRDGRKGIVSISAGIVEITKSTLPTTFDSLKLRLSTYGAQSGQ